MGFGIFYRNFIGDIQLVGVPFPDECRSAHQTQAHCFGDRAPRKSSWSTDECDGGGRGTWNGSSAGIARDTDV
jgi:hypothetical protein